MGGLNTKFSTLPISRPQVHMVGHSQGATIALAMLANMPETAQDTGVLVALAPVVYVKFVRSITLSAFCAQANVSG
jgi:alpha-beta hydrolase superfamily lysophospholipase